MTRVILASASQARARMLKDAGVDVEIQSSNADEQSIKNRLLETGTAPDQIALALANAKALSVSESVPDALVIGADQILIHEGKLYDKPRSMEEARLHLQAMRAKTHRLISAVSVCQDRQTCWSTYAIADLTMREFSEAFLSSYLEAFGDKALSSVGAYHLEGLGAQLFSQIRGDYFTVLGLPLLELLEFLRTRGILNQ